MDPDFWPAPLTPEPVRAAVTVPGSKSVTNRVIPLAALSQEPVRIHRPLVARDTLLMLAAIERLGSEVSRCGPDDDPDAEWLVGPANWSNSAHIDCGLSGTVMRFVPPIAALGSVPFSFFGDPHAAARPLRPLLDVLRQLGCRVDPDTANRLPFSITGHGSLPGGTVQLDASASSQFVSALLLVGARCDQTLTVRLDPPHVPSLPHIEMTTQCLQLARATVTTESAPDVSPRAWKIEPGPLQLPQLTVEPDISNATVFIAAALATGGQVLIRDWPRQSLQPSDQIVSAFEQLGAIVTPSEEGMAFNGDGHIRGGDLDLSQIGEVTPTVAALALFADSPTVLRGIGHLRGHETDRLDALCREINRLGGTCTATSDSLTITPRKLVGTDLRTYDDHRMATFAAIVGLRVPNVRIENVGTTQKTFPRFAEQWAAAVKGGSTPRGDGPE